MGNQHCGFCVCVRCATFGRGECSFVVALSRWCVGLVCLLMVLWDSPSETPPCYLPKTRSIFGIVFGVFQLTSILMQLRILPVLAVEVICDVVHLRRFGHVENIGIAAKY